jgi:hypothetical protein
MAAIRAKLVRSGFSGAQMRLPEAGLSIKPLGVKRSAVGQRIARTRTSLATWVDPRILLVTFGLEGVTNVEQQMHVPRSWESRNTPYLALQLHPLPTS